MKMLKVYLINFLYISHISLFIEFVDLYVDYMMNESIDDAYNAFQEGFDSVMQESAISIFRPEELMELLEGSKTLDFKDLEKVTKYDGFDPDSQTIRNFWKVVHEFSDEQKKLLLFFATGSDRVPVGGLYNNMLTDWVNISHGSQRSCCCNHGWNQLPVQFFNLDFFDHCCYLCDNTGQLFQQSFGSIFYK